MNCEYTKSVKRKCILSCPNSFTSQWQAGFSYFRISMKIKVRKAKKEDLPSVLSLIKELASYEKAPEEVKVTAKELEKDGFGKKKIFECFVACLTPSFPPLLEERGPEGAVVGIALYYIKYSTWKGKCIYLDDIIVTESLRGHGIGKQLFEAVLQVAKKMKARKLEWQVLEWNKPAINFYKKYSTVFDAEWINCKLAFEK